MPDNPNPYVGPSPFELDDALRFYGRNDEATELFSLTRAHSVVLFYSQSGAGKTSLINAGVIPKLKKERIEVFPVARIGVKLPREVNLTSIENVFVFNTLLSLEGEKKKRDFDQLGKMSLSDYLKEEVSNGQPKYSYPLRVLIFDQFEELFTTFPEHWSQRDGFFISISEALEHDPLLRIVFAMREEYVAELEPFAPMLPLRFQKRFRLERLRKQAAKKAVEGPLESTERSYARNVAEGLVNNLLQQQIKYFDGTRATPGEFVEPVQLQIVCRSLWEDLPETVKVIDQRAISQFGDVDAALAKYYSKCLAKIAAKTEANEAALRIWFQQSLITPVNTRATAYVDEGSTEGLSPATLAMLEEQRLIRPELRGGAKWYELTHDRFIEPIRRSNKEWFDSLPEGSFIYELEQRADNWKEGGRKDEALLPEDVVLKYRNTAKYSPELTKITPTGLLEEYVNASETAATRRKAIKFRWQVVAIALGVIAGVILIAVSFIASNKAIQAKQATTATQIEQGKQAKVFATLSGKEYDGLLLGLQAMTLAAPGDAPPEAVEGLREALAAVDRKVWLRYPISFASRPERFQFSTDGTLALTVNNNEFCVWNTLTGLKKLDKCIQRDKAGEWWKPQFSPDDKLVYALVKPLPLATPAEGSSSRVTEDLQDTPERLKQSIMWVVNVDTGESVAQLQSPLEGALSFQISNNSQYVLTDFVDKGVKIFNVNGVEHTPPLDKQRFWYQFALSSDGSRLVAIYGDKTIDLIATDDGHVVNSFVAEIQKDAKVFDVISFSPDGKYGVLVRPSVKGTEAAGFVWENASGRQLVSFNTKAHKVNYVAFSSDNSLILVSDNTELEIIDRSSGSLVSATQLSKGLLMHAGLKTLLLQNGRDMCTISVWNAPNQPPLQYHFRTKSNINKAESTLDGAKVIVLDEANTIQVWTLTEQLPTSTFDIQQLITEGCKKVVNHKDEFTKFDEICKPRLTPQ
jgi:WD40 repeat protein